MDTTEFEDAITKLEYLSRIADIKTDWGKPELTMRARNLAGALLDPCTLFHTKIVAKIVKQRGGDRIDVVTAWLHDIGRAVVDKGHREVGAAWAKKWVNKFYITEEEIQRIHDGIRNHGVNSKPETKTGKLLQLADALAVFDPGWATMVVKYDKIWGNANSGAELLLKKFQVIKNKGSEDDVDAARRVMEALQIH